jgi:diguanylate cyclase (GGDEF)-like protein
MACDRIAAIDAGFGRETGDRVLDALGAAIRQGLRAGDLVARVGSDRFAVLFKGADAALAREACGRIAAAVRALEGAALPAGLDIGPAFAVEQSQAGDTVRSLMTRASLALLVDKGPDA